VGNKTAAASSSSETGLVSLWFLVLLFLNTVNETHKTNEGEGNS
jgi:hypothetical protein